MSGDRLINEAWGRRMAALEAYRALPDAGEGSDHSEAERVQLAVIDRAEEQIRALPAATPEGIATKLWLALDHLTTDKADHDPARCRDLAYFTAKDDELDWTARLIVAALVSLAAMT